MNNETTLSALHKNSAFYALIEPVSANTDLPSWANRNVDYLNGLLRAHKAILFRGFKQSDDTFSAFVNTLITPSDYIYRSTPRTSVAPGMYTATEFPRNYVIAQHCENAYQRYWPMKLFFQCKQAALVGGETPLTDISNVTRDLDPDIKEIFRRKGVLYVRNYGSGVDLPWQEVFQTQERSEVDRFCARHGIEHLWTSPATLQTRQRRPAFATHPQTNELLWFNQAHLFHVSNLEQATQSAVRTLFDQDNLPRNAYFGDGSPIEPSVLAHIREVFDRHTTASSWKNGDILMVDNMQAAHGRRPYIGPRQVLVMMGDIVDGDSNATGGILAA